MKLRPISHDTLRAELRHGVLNFAFKKLDGDLRIAIGTTNLAQIPAANRPTGRRQSSPNVVVFFDLEKREWRSLSTRVEVFVA